MSKAKKTEKKGEDLKSKSQKSHFSRFVQIGRIVLVNYGPHEGKIGVIADVIDQNRALVTGPLTGLPTQAINFKRLSLTDFVLKIGRGASTKTIKAAFQKDDIIKKWEDTSVAKKRASHLKRANLNDFERYKVGVLKRKKNNVIREATKKLANWARPNAANVKARAERRKHKGEDKKTKPAEKKAKVEKKPETKKTEKPAEKPVEKPAEKPAAKAPAEKKPAPEKKPAAKVPAEKKPAADKSPEQPAEHAEGEKKPAEKKPAGKGAAEKKPAAVKGAAEKKSPAPEKSPAQPAEPKGDKSPDQPAEPAEKKPAAGKGAAEKKPAAKPAGDKAPPAEKKPPAKQPPKK